MKALNLPTPMNVTAAVAEKVLGFDMLANTLVNFTESVVEISAHSLSHNFTVYHREILLDLFFTKQIDKFLFIFLFLYKNILEIGNFNSKRDWGHARDYAEAIYRILQHRKPLDLVIATNKSYSIKDFIKECFKFLKIKVRFIGKGLNEKVVDENGKVWIKINKKFIRPKDIKILLGNSSLAKKLIKWKNKTSFKDLAIEMMKEDLRKVSLK